MNIFVLDKNPITAARYMCDKHVVKMILESAQLLNNAIYKLDPESAILKPTHMNHPCSLWAQESGANFYWLFHHLWALCVEYSKRYGKDHKYSIDGLPQKLLRRYIAINGDVMCNPANFCNCTPYKDMDDVVEAYRRYYIEEKSSFAKWKLGNVPEWYKVN